MRTPSPVPAHVPAARYRDGSWQALDDRVSVEAPFTVTWIEEDVPFPARSGTCELWAWPEDPAVLALGHVLLDRVPLDHALDRSVHVAQTGKRAFHVRVGPPVATVRPGPPERVAPERLLGAMAAFMDLDGLWEETGCFHRAGIYDPAQDRLVARAEDIGRHNCLDRLAGRSVLEKTPLTDKILLTTARLTSSLCAKALRAGLRVLVSRSAVTTAAVDMARNAGAVLVGFARPQESRFTVFVDDLSRMSRLPGS